ncbi:hypothetical protein AX15_000096 [Amanita polypyramis BW_CC]|nr:hypothetical protein AX15_000096 [Amanita polypyramis BW_CC]
MFGAPALSTTRRVHFSRPFSTSFIVRNATRGSFHSTRASPQEQQRHNLERSHSRGDGSEHGSSDTRGQEGLVDSTPGGRQPVPPEERTATAHDHNAASPSSSSQNHSYTESETGSSSSTRVPFNDDPTVQHLTTPNFEAIKQRLRGWSEQTAIVIRNRADDFTTRSKTTFSQLGAYLNKVTGYEEIEARKGQVVEKEKHIKEARQAARDAKLVYQQAVIQRSNSQREVNELLQRKSIWTDDDVGRFTTLVRQDHLYEQEEQRAKAAVDETEDAVERKFSQLMRTILARYHEEQVWSDKIRSASTYGSLAALGLNLAVFILAIAVVEPWKRRNLAKTFENKIQELSVENAAKLDASMQEIGRQLAQQGQLLEGAKDELKVAFETMAEAEKERQSRREAELESLPTVEAEHVEQPSTKTRELELVAAGLGAGAFLATALSWFWIGR